VSRRKSEAIETFVKSLDRLEDCTANLIFWR